MREVARLGRLLGGAARQRPAEVRGLIERLLTPSVKLAPDLSDVLQRGANANLDDICARIADGMEFGIRERDPAPEDL